MIHGRTIYWGCVQWCITITRPVDSLGQQFLDLLDQASWCHAGMAGSSWLHSCGMGCHRLWCQGIVLDSWHVRNSGSLLHLCCWCCRCSRCGLHAWCRWGQCRLFHSEAESCLQCGRGATGDSVNHLDTAFMEVPPCVVVCGTNASAYLIAVPGINTHHSGKNPNLSEGVVHCNLLTSIQWCKYFALFISLCLSGFRTGINLLTDVWG